MSNVPVPYYYNQMTAKEKSYVDYMGDLNKSTNSAIIESTQKMQSAIVDTQIVTALVLSRQLGAMGSDMNMGFARLSDAVREATEEICNRLDDINHTLETPLGTASSYTTGRYKVIVRVCMQKLWKTCRKLLKKIKQILFRIFLWVKPTC